MKLTKLSLAVMLALGAFSVSSSAIPLEDAIKDVDMGGYLRYRYTNANKENPKNESGSKSSANHEFKAVVNFKAALDDNFFAVVGLQYLSKDGSGEYNDQNNWDSQNDAIKVRQALLGYNIANTTIMAGRQEVGAFFTDDMIGDGIKVLNKDIEGMTLAAIAFDNLDNDGDIGTLGLGKALYGPDGLLRGKSGINADAMLKGYRETNTHNLYGLAVIGSYDPIAFQLWYAYLEDVASLFAAELVSNFDLNPVNLELQGQYAHSSIDNSFSDATSGVADDADFYAGKATAKFEGFDVFGGYLAFNTDKDNASIISYEDQGKFISPGEELLNYSLFYGENSYWFAGAGYTFYENKLRIGGEYIDGTNKAFDVETDRSEWVARADYAYSKKLKFKTWYSRVNEDEKGSNSPEDDLDQNKFRFEAKYSF